jgi:hypothetical protein
MLVRLRLPSSKAIAAEIHYDQRSCGGPLISPVDQAVHRCRVGERLANGLDRESKSPNAAASRLTRASKMGTLAEVVQQGGWKDEVEPCRPDRLGAEVAHVSIERLGASDREHHGTE